MIVFDFFAIFRIFREKCAALYGTSYKLSNIIYRHADGNKGWPEAAPFDRIIITCQTEKVPTFLLDQLKVGGILVAPVGPSGQEELFRVKRKENGIETECLMPVKFVPMVDGTER